MGLVERLRSFDSQQYQRMHEDFPGTSLLDQFFTETTFEAYRKLGMEAMESRIACKREGSRQGLDLIFS
jgi:hypothetical protein